MKRYFAIFTTNEDGVDVSFPDLPGCLTCAKDWEQALDYATDALGAWLAHAEAKFVNQPSTYTNLQSMIGDGSMLVPIAVDQAIIDSYKKLKRFNVVFPADTLSVVDKYRKKLGLKRSKILQIAAEEYMAKHPLSM